MPARMPGKPWKACGCSSHPDNVAIVTTIFQPWDKPKTIEINFMRLHAYKLACFQCGGEVKPADLGETVPDHIGAGTITSRLRQLGIIAPRQRRT